MKPWGYVTDVPKYHNAGIWSTDQNILRFMFKTYSSSSSLVITSRWFATSRLASSDWSIEYCNVLFCQKLVGVADETVTQVTPSMTLNCGCFDTFISQVLQGYGVGVWAQSLEYLKKNNFTIFMSYLTYNIAYIIFLIPHCFLFMFFFFHSIVDY